MAPTYVSSARDVDDEIVTLILERVSEEPSKPWTVSFEVAQSAEEDFEEVNETLRHLTMSGTLTPTANGDLQVAADNSH